MADSPNTTTPSRRTVLAGISVAAAPVAVAVEKSVATIAPEPDPIFAVIDLHRSNLARCDEVSRWYKPFRSKEPESSPGLVIGDYPGGASRAPGPIHPAISGVFDPDAKPPLVVQNKWQIEAIACCLPEPEREAWIEEKFAELRALREKQAAEAEASPRGIAWRKLDDTYVALSRSMELLIETRPTTVAGMSAALDCWLEFVDATPGLYAVGDDTETFRFLERLADAVRDIV
jgi:hypothetical protein